VQQDTAQTGDAPNPAATINIENRSKPRALLRVAVQSRKPEVLFDIGAAQGMLNPSNDDAQTERLAWWLAACQRGLDCTAKAAWVQNRCSYDPKCASAGSPSDLVRMLAGDDWSVVRQRANDIDAKLDAGQRDALGLGT